MLVDEFLSNLRLKMQMSCVTMCVCVLQVKLLGEWVFKSK